MRTVYSLRIARAQFISFTETLPTTARNFSSTVCTGLYSVVHQYMGVQKTTSSIGNLFYMRHLDT